MSKQSSNMGEKETSPKANGKKRHGIWVLYMKYVGTGGFNRLVGPKWIKLRSYESERVAKEAMRRAKTKWNNYGATPSWDFKIEST